MKESVVQPSRRPRRLGKLGLERVVRCDALDQIVGKDVALGVGPGSPVHVKERQLAFRIGQRLSVDDKRIDLVFPLRVPATPPRSSFRVIHAPRFDGGDYALVHTAAGFARDVLQHATFDVHGVVTLLIARTMRLDARGVCGRGRSMVPAWPITTKDGYDSRALDVRHHVLRSRRAPEERAP